MGKRNDSGRSGFQESCGNLDIQLFQEGLHNLGQYKQKLQVRTYTQREPNYCSQETCEVFSQSPTDRR